MGEGRNRLVGLCGVLLTAGTMAVMPANVAEAQPKTSAADEAKVKQQAIDAYKAGMKEYKAEDYEAALPHFKKADELYPGAAPKYKVAEILDKLGRNQEAVEAYRTFIDSNPGEKYKDELAEAGKRIAALEATLPAVVTVEVTPEAAAGASSVTVDDQPAEGNVIELEPGEHTIVVTAEGYEPYTETVIVKPNQERALTVALVPLATPAPTPQPLPEPIETDDEGPSNIPAYVTLGIAGAGVVLGVVFGVQALSAKSDFDENPTVEHADDAERAALIADMSFGVALTFGITGTVLLISNMVGDDEEELEDDAIEAKLIPEVTPLVGTKGGGAAATWTF